MSKIIDCVLIGSNEMNFSEIESITKLAGTNSAAYRDLSYSFLYYEGKPYTASDIYNSLFYNKNILDDSIGPLNSGNAFSSTISYLGTYLKRRGINVDYINSFNTGKAALAKMLTENTVLSVGITTTLYVTIHPIIEIISFVKKYNPDAKIIIGGPFIHNQVRIKNKRELEYIFNSVKGDFYICNSQGEEALVNTINAIKDNRPFDNIMNVYYKKQNEYVINGFFEEENNLSQNMVDWNLFKGSANLMVNTRTSISCPYSCAFCTFPKRSGKYLTASLSDIENELDTLNSLGTVTSVNFIDDTFNIPPNRFKEILHMFIRKKYSFKWFAFYRCQFADRETIELLKESGCEGVFLGIESGSNKILENMNKSATIEKYQKGLELLNEYGITSFASFIVGFPGETYETFQETLKFIKECNPTYYRAQVWYYDPWTPITERKDEFKLEGSQFDWKHSTMDSSTACELVEKMILTVNNSTFVPGHNFDFSSVINLMHRGMTFDRVKMFLNTFNDCVKEKITNPVSKETSRDSILKFINIMS